MYSFCVFVCKCRCLLMIATTLLLILGWWPVWKRSLANYQPWRLIWRGFRLPTFRFNGEFVFVRLYDQIESYLAKAKRIQIILKTDFKGKFVYIQLLKCAIPLLSIRTKHVQLGFSKVSDSILATGGIVWGQGENFLGQGRNCLAVGRICLCNINI